MNFVEKIKTQMSIPWVTISISETSPIVKRSYHNILNSFTLLNLNCDLIECEDHNKRVECTEWENDSHKLHSHLHFPLFQPYYATCAQIQKRSGYDSEISNIKRHNFGFTSRMRKLSAKYCASRCNCAQQRMQPALFSI